MLVDDNVRLAGLVAERLKPHGYTCDQAHTLNAADEALDTAHYDVIVLDLGLPDGDGLLWMRERRKGDLLPPTLILTARNGLEDRVSGLDAGADDYVVKPFDVAELAARLRALMRRPGQRSAPDITVGPLCFDVASRTASYAGRSLNLSRREGDLLELLMRRAGGVVRRSMIEGAMYRFDESFTPNAIEVNISRLRRKLEAAGGARMLYTIRGLGYIIRDASDGQ